MEKMKCLEKKLYNDIFPSPSKNPPTIAATPIHVILEKELSLSIQQILIKI